MWTEHVDIHLYFLELKGHVGELSGVNGLTTVLR